MSIKIKKIDLLEKLYNEGERDISTLAKEIESSESTVRTYLNRLREKGKIAIEDKTEKYTQYKALRGKGIKNADTLAKMLNVPKRRIYEYSQKLKLEGFYEETLYQRTIRMYNSGIKDARTIAYNLRANQNTINGYIQKASKQGLINTDSANKLPSNERQDNYSIASNENAMKNAIKKLLSQKYPIEIARELGIKPVEVFDVWDNMSDEEQKIAMQEFVKSRRVVFRELNRLRDKDNLSVEQALRRMEDVFSIKDPIKLFDIADIYYALGEEVGCQRQMNILINDNQVLRNKAIERKELISTEIKAGRIRGELKRARDNGMIVSYDDLCRRHCVRTRFIIDIAGMENRYIETPNL